MESGDKPQPTDIQTEPATNDTLNTDDGSGSKKKKELALNWSKIGVGALSALAGILGTPYGIYVAAAVLVLGVVGFFITKGMFKDWQFESLKKQAGSKTGSEAASNQHAINGNRDAVDDFLGREHRS